MRKRFRPGPAEFADEGQRRKYQRLCIAGTFLSYCIPSIMLTGVLWDPARAQGSVLMLLLAVTITSRIAVAIAKERMASSTE